MKSELPAPLVTATIGGVITNRVIKIKDQKIQNAKRKRGERVKRGPIVREGSRPKKGRAPVWKNGERRTDGAGGIAITVSATETEWTAIDAAASAAGLTRSAFVRRAGMIFELPPPELKPTVIRCLTASLEEWTEIDRRAANAKVSRSDFLRKACAAAIADGNGASDVESTSKSAPDTTSTKKRTRSAKTTTRSDER